MKFIAVRRSANIREVGALIYGEKLSHFLVSSSALMIEYIRVSEKHSVEIY